MPRQPKRGGFAQDRWTPFPGEPASHVTQESQTSLHRATGHQSFAVEAGPVTETPSNIYSAQEFQDRQDHRASPYTPQILTGARVCLAPGSYTGVSPGFGRPADSLTPTMMYPSAPTQAAQTLLMTSHLHTDPWYDDARDSNFLEIHGYARYGASAEIAIAPPFGINAVQRRSDGTCEPSQEEHHHSYLPSLHAVEASQSTMSPSSVFQADYPPRSLQPDTFMPPVAPAYVPSADMSGFHGRWSQEHVSTTHYENFDLLWPACSCAGDQMARTGTGQETSTMMSENVVKANAELTPPLPAPLYQNSTIAIPTRSTVRQQGITPYPYDTGPSSGSEWDSGWLLMGPASDGRHFVASHSASHCLTVSKASGDMDTYVALHGSIRPGPELHLYLKPIYPTIAESGTNSERRAKAIRGRLKGILLHRLTDTIGTGSIVAAIHAAGHESSVSVRDRRSSKDKGPASAAKADKGRKSTSANSLPVLSRVLDPLANRLEWMPGWLDVNREQVKTFIEGSGTSAKTQPQSGGASSFSELPIDQIVPQHEPILHFRRIRGANAQAAQASWDDLAGKTLLRPNDSLVQLYKKNKSPYTATDSTASASTPDPYWRRIVMGSVELYNSQTEQQSTHC